MATSNNPDDSDEFEQNQRVVDEEGTVDQQVKNRILQARKRVDENETLLFVQAPANPQMSLGDGEKLAAWGTCVRQYIRAIQPLLESDKIDDAAYYWEEVPIMSDTVPVPSPPYNHPESTADDSIDWSVFSRGQLDAMDIAREYGLTADFEPPEPKPVEFKGLQDILNRDRIRKTWHFYKRPNAIGKEERDPQWIVHETPIPKQVLETAVSKADAFLQQAGVGLEIGHDKTDDPEEDPF